MNEEKKTADASLSGLKTIASSSTFFFYMNFNCQIVKILYVLVAATLDRWNVHATTKSYILDIISI